MISTPNRETIEASPYKTVAVTKHQWSKYYQSNLWKTCILYNCNTGAS